MFWKCMTNLERGKIYQKLVCIPISSVITRRVCINFVTFAWNLVVHVPGIFASSLSTSTGHLDWQVTSSNCSMVIFISLADMTKRFQELCGEKFSSGPSRLSRREWKLAHWWIVGGKVQILGFHCPIYLYARVRSS